MEVETLALNTVRIRILFFAFFLTFLMTGYNLALTAPTANIVLDSYGQIVVPTAPTVLDGYECGNYNSTHYYAKNTITGNYELLSTDASSTISYALSKLTLGRTWQEALTLRGDFVIDSTIVLNQGNVLVD